MLSLPRAGRRALGSGPRARAPTAVLRAGASASGVKLNGMNVNMNGVGCNHNLELDSHAGTRALLASLEVGNAGNANLFRSGNNS